MKQQHSGQWPLLDEDDEFAEVRERIAGRREDEGMKDACRDDIEADQHPRQGIRRDCQEIVEICGRQSWVDY